MNRSYQEPYNLRGDNLKVHNLANDLVRNKIAKNRNKRKNSPSSSFNDSKEITLDTESTITISLKSRNLNQDLVSKTSNERSYTHSEDIMKKQTNILNLDRRMTSYFKPTKPSNINYAEWETSIISNALERKSENENLQFIEDEPNLLNFSLFLRFSLMRFLISSS